MPEKCHAGAGGELYVRDGSGICSPARVAGNDMTVAENFFDNGDMTQITRALYAWLQVNDSPQHGRAGDMPAVLVGAVCPLPGVGLRVPGYKYAMKLVVTLIGPPGAGWIWEDIDPWIWP